MPTDSQFERFVKERRYIQNVSPNTIKIYEWAWSYWKKYGSEPLAFVTGMREGGKNPIGCNIYIRAMNAFLRWADEKPIPKLQEPEVIPPTFSTGDVQKILKYKPQTKELRFYILLLTLFDTGLRIDAALGIKRSDIDFENMLVKVITKGNKERLTPFSFELRKWLWKQLNSHNFGYLFCTKDGARLLHRNVMRGIKGLCVRAGATPPRRLIHSCRHTFAINYLRQGGSVFHLQKALGHTTLDMSRRYANLLTEDLQQMQQKVSILNRMR